MTLNTTVDGSKLTIALEGRLDTTTAPELEEELGKYNDAVNDVTLDFEKLEYISSAGLRVLLGEQKMMSKKDGKMVVKNVNETIMEVFEITGFTDVITIE